MAAFTKNWGCRVHLVAEPVLKAGAKLGEGAIWDPKASLLHWVDIEGFTVNSFDPVSGKNRAIKLPENVSTVVKDKTGNLVVCLERQVVRVDSTGKTVPIASVDEPKTNRLNDGKCDPAGRLWFGSMARNFEDASGKLYTLNANHQVQAKVEAVTISNGIVWSNDAKTMYYIDTPTGQMDAFDYDIESGGISNRRLAVKNSWGGYFDGMTIDAEDNVYVAIWEGGCVIKINPRTGELLEKIEVPGAFNITTCAFGGKDLQDLYITSATADSAKYPNSGALFRVHIPDAQGLPAFEYAG
jgi:sugar lactone lactonase YvrE